MPHFLLTFFTALLQLTLTSHSLEKPKTLDFVKSHVPTVGTLVRMFTTDYYFDFEIDDFDLDGEQEVGVLRRDSDYPYVLCIYEMDSAIYSYPSTPLHHRLQNEELFKLEGSPLFHWLTFHVLDESGLIYLYNRRFQIVDSLFVPRGRDETGKGYWNGWLRYPRLVDLNHDGRLDILFTINTGSDASPRVLLGYDLFTKKLLLEKHFAPMPRKATVVDLNGDGEKEILLDLAGASDGRFFGEFARDQSYLVLLDLKGNIIKSWSYGGESSYLNYKVRDLDDDHSPEIIVSFFSRLSESQEKSKIEIIDGQSLRVRTRFLNPDNPQSFEDFFLYDFDGDSEPEILTTSRTGLMFMLHDLPLEHELRVSHIIKWPHPISFVSADDVNGDGKAELFLLAKGKPSALYIVSSDLRPIGTILLPGEVLGFKMRKLASATVERGDYLLLADHGIWRWSFPVEALFPPPGFSLRWNGYRFEGKAGKLLLGLAALVFGMLFFALLALRQKPQWRMPPSHRVASLTIDESGTIKQFNPAFLRLSGLSRERLHGANVRSALKTSPLHPVLAVLEEFFYYERDFLHKEITIGEPGKQRTLALEISRSNHSSRNRRIHVLLLDLTETTQTDRLKLWGAMAQRVAHKTKTPLGTVMLAIQRLQREYRKDTPEMARKYDRIVRGAVGEIERVRSAINSFVKFTKLSDPIFETKEFHYILMKIISDYAERTPQAVQIYSNLLNSQIWVKVDVEQFQEAIDNVLDNAVTALRGEGHITIKTEIETHPLSEYGGQEFVLLEIRDDGMGISEESLEQIFTPGYTTFEHGTGMGLVFTKSIIESHGGEIHVSSKKDIGTTVSIRLPIIAKGDMKP